MIIRRLCVLLDAERIYRELSTILEGEADLDFASIMVQVCSLSGNIKLGCLRAKWNNTFQGFSCLLFLYIYIALAMHNWENSEEGK